MVTGLGKTRWTAGFKIKGLTIPALLGLRGLPLNFVLFSVSLPFSSHSHLHRSSSAVSHFLSPISSLNPRPSSFLSPPPPLPPSRPPPFLLPPSFLSPFPSHSYAFGSSLRSRICLPVAPFLLPCCPSKIFVLSFSSLSLRLSLPAGQEPGKGSVPNNNNKAILPSTSQCALHKTRPPPLPQAAVCWGC